MLLEIFQFLLTWNREEGWKCTWRNYANCSKQVHKNLKLKQCQ